MVSDVKKGDYSMNPERLQLKGLLAESKKSFRSLDTEASGLVILIRSLINPYEEITNLDTDKILISVTRLNNIKSEMIKLAEKIRKLESEFEQ